MGKAVFSDKTRQTLTNAQGVLKACCACCEKSFCTKFPNCALAGTTAATRLIRRRILARRVEAAVKKLRANLNRCESCGAWVCNDCFVIPDSGDGLCRACAQKIGISGQSSADITLNRKCKHK